jgi:2',3'-cyclic-nucleotide 2'-phosphodiesterase (5'-nucleotidase family)
MSARLKTRLISTITATIMAVALFAAHPATGLAQSAKLTLLHINDVYQISPQRGVGGLAELMTLLKKERARSAKSWTTLGGELLSLSVMSGLTKGAQMIALMNAIGLDFAGLGNHEFDFGNANLKARMAESKFTWLATNTVGPDGAPIGGAKASVMRQVGDFKIGIFSLLTPETTTSPALKLA